MTMEVITSLLLLFVGVAVLVIIHLCIVGRAFRNTQGNNSGTAIGRTLNGSPTISRDQIKKLPSFEYEEVDTTREETGPTDCAVCLEGFKVGENCRLLPKCNHSFHAECIDSWLVKNGACPVCRTGIDSPESRPEGSRDPSGDREVRISVLEVELNQIELNQIL